MAKRFFQVLRARPLTPSEQAEVATLLRPEEATLFWGQQTADQRHGLETARKLAARRPGDTELIRAGLLHDVGKSATQLGPITRTLATIGGAIRLPLPQRFVDYSNHGPIGAEALRAAGAESLVVAFAAHHPAPAPDGVDERRWALLLAADDD